MRRLLSSLSIAAAGILLSTVIFAVLRNLEINNAQAAFNGIAQQRLDALETNVVLTMNNLVSVGALFDASQNIKREEFNRFTSCLIARNQAIQALEWIPRVPKRSRGKYEADARHEGFPKFHFTERLPSAQLTDAGQREEYFPVFFVAPFKGNEKALGYDLASDPDRRAALQRAADSGAPVATRRIKLVQETADQYGFLAYRPIYRGGIEPASIEQRREALIGFALAVFRVADIVERAGAASSGSGLNLAIFDRDGKPGERLLYPKGAHLDAMRDLPPGFQAVRAISVAGRTWELVAYPRPDRFRPLARSSWAIFFSGILLTCLLTAHLTERRRAEQALQQSEERARLLFATIPHPAYVFDAQTLAFLEVNQAAVQQYGYSREEFLSMRTTDIRPDAEVARLDRALRQTRSPRGNAGQWKHRSKDGRISEMIIDFHYLDYDNHKACLAIAQDVTERNRVEIELRNAQKLEAVGRLAAGIAHEINTPIQFVGDNLRFLRDGFASILKILQSYRNLTEKAVGVEAVRPLAQEVATCENELDIRYLAEEAPKAIEQSLDGVVRVATLVQAMKVFAHPDRKEKAATDINEALLSTLTVARNELKYVANVETDLGELPPVCCNIGELNQVFLNLLVNAAHSIADVKQRTNEKDTIRVRTSILDGMVLISIADTGTGIPENIRDKVFDPFFTTKESGQGTGQGLAIARSIVVDRHGGTLTFTSQAGQGTTFDIRLPRNGNSECECEKIAHENQPQ